VSVSLRKRRFDMECWRCKAQMTVSMPRVFCDPCRIVFAEAAAKAVEEAWVTLARDYGIMRGDKVRRKTPAEKEFERDVLADVGRL